MRSCRTLVAAVAAAALVAAVATAGASVQQPPVTPSDADGASFRGNAMWIWYVDKAEGGNLQKIIARAKSRDVSTVYVKAGDGSDGWSQFTPSLVSTLQRGGLNVCAWQYVYGDNPVGEARVGAEAVDDGADCLVIDAESEYETEYPQAVKYIAKLRKAIGADFPVGLASFPYVHYHPAFPYSVFLGPGGAQFNLPQVYWKAIGTSVDKAMSTTYTYNRVYQRPISPTGQLYDNPSAREIRRFRQTAKASGFAGTSWWSWQHATPAGFDAATQPRIGHARGYKPSHAYPTLRKESRGDLVVWAQEHLADGGYFGQTPTGEFERSTTIAVRAFQADQGMDSTGILDAATWKALLDNTDAKPVAWGSGGHDKTAVPSAPESADLPAVRDELGHGHRG